MLLATGVLVVGIAPFAVARTGDILREGVRNGTATKETSIVANVRRSSGGTGGYSTRQSNLSTSGGGAIYGCRSNSASTSEPCLRASNLSNGRVFEFAANDGAVAGVITVGGGGDTKKPFTTNATGIATGLNADRVDSKSATELTTDAVTAMQALNPLAQVDPGGAPVQTRGVPSGGVTDPAGAGTYNVVFNGDLTSCALSATLIGTAAGQVSVTPTVAADKKTTAIDVRTFSGAGLAFDRGFHLAASC